MREDESRTCPARRVKSALAFVMAATLLTAAGGWQPVGSERARTAAARRTPGGMATGPARPGAQVAGGVEELGLLRWRFTAGGAVRASPVLRDGALYVGSTAGHLHALEADSGEELWTYDAGAPVVSAVAATDDHLFLQDRGGTVHALRRGDGRRLWTRTTGPELPLPWGREGWDYVGPAPVLAPPADSRPATLLVAAGDGHLYALDPGTGETRWRFDSGARLRATPVVRDDRVYLGDAAGIFRAIDLDEGRPLWRFETDGHAMDPEDFGFDRRQIYSSAALDGGRLFFGSRDANVYALDASTGDLLWKASDGTSAWVMGTPAVGDERVWVTRSSSARVRALDAGSGEEIWSVQTEGAVFSSPVRVDGTVYLGNGAGMLLALDARTGERRWRYGLGGGVWSAPTLEGGSLYVGDDDGQVHAFGARPGPTPRLAVFWDDELSGRSVLGAAPRHRGILDHFAGRGYEQLDEAGAAAFMTARIDDRIPSAVVFAMDALPPTLAADGDGDDKPLLRRYLEAGGRVVWLGMPPGLHVFDESGRIVAIDREIPATLLGVDHGAFTGDRHPAWPTEAGRRMGLHRWWIGSAAVPSGADVTVLAADELGRPAAWIRRYGTARGSRDGGGSGRRGAGGFVQLYPTSDAGRLDEIRAVVEHDLFRSAATRESAYQRGSTNR